MQEEEKQNHSAGTPPEQPKKHKKEKGKSLLETMREIDAKEAEKEAEILNGFTDGNGRLKSVV